MDLCILAYMLYLHDGQLDLFPYLFVQHEVWNRFIAVFKMEKKMFNAGSVMIFVGFNFRDADTLLLKKIEELLSLLF